MPWTKDPKSTNPVPDFIPFQLVKLVKTPPIGERWLHEIKFDGYRLQARVVGGQLWSGSDGDLGGKPLTSRKAALAEVLDAGDELARRKFRWVDEFAGAEPRALFAAACELGFEGIVSKRRDRPYRSGKGDEWVKTKCRPGVEVVIGGWRTEGSSFGSLLAGVWDGGRLRYVGNVGAGYGDETVADLISRLAPLETPRHAFELGDPPKKTRDVHWARPELVAEIELAEFTASGKIRHGSFKGLWLDKTAEDLRAEDRLG